MKLVDMNDGNEWRSTGSCLDSRHACLHRERAFQYLGCDMFQSLELLCQPPLFENFWCLLNRWQTDGFFESFSNTYIIIITIIIIIIIIVIMPRSYERIATTTHYTCKYWIVLFQMQNICLHMPFLKSVSAFVCLLFTLVHWCYFAFRVSDKIWHLNVLKYHKIIIIIVLHYSYIKYWLTNSPTRSMSLLCNYRNPKCLVQCRTQSDADLRHPIQFFCVGLRLNLIEETW